ncbi:helix-turn-helix domain-containing protein [Ectopseudomonas mendocina]|uniref:hypothetical protein n=1 Tax=Ectopseudomonas mendocina TaxID=300 RepID=UPI00376EAF64
MKPDASRHNPDPRYIAGLIEQTGLTQEAVARRLGITPKALRNYKSESMAREIPYATQFALECLASQDT